jgi:GT2 family glycosyltransferase
MGEAQVPGPAAGRVCALVLTRDRRTMLSECLAALAAQTHPVSEVVVFDNSSRDGTAEWLRAVAAEHEPPLRVVRSEHNLGGAGGYAELLRVGEQTESDWLWLMDDDAEPQLDTLERLLASPVARDRGTAALCSAVVHRDGTVDPLHRCRLRRFILPLPSSAYAPGQTAEVDCASFVGLLVRTEAARGAGLPRAEFFIGYDDAEYSLRLRRQGNIRLVPESRITHKIVIGGGQDTARSRFWNRLLGAAYTSAPWESYWRDLYRVRNFVALRVQHENGLTAGQLAVVIAGYAGRSVLYDQRPLRRLPWLLRFALRGRRGDFSAPTPEAWQDYVRTGRRPAEPRTAGG